MPFVENSSNFLLSRKEPTVMRKLLLPVLLICLCACPVLGLGADDLEISITLVRGERSRDSGGSKSTISITQGGIIYEQAYFGMAGARRKPVRKEFKLSDEDKRRLIELIGQLGLLVKDSLEYPMATSGIRRYFKISIQLKLNEKTGAINMEGPTSAVEIKEQKLYQNSTALIEEVYRIINKMDEDVSYKPLID
jgi:hypothetical protein